MKQKELDRTNWREIYCGCVHKMGGNTKEYWDVAPNKNDLRVGQPLFVITLSVLDTQVRNLQIVVYIPIGSMYAIYGNIYHQYTSNVSIYTIHGSYGICLSP